ncbi:hypothetical protein AB4Z46_28140 [Variovorax sp. M-6]|uniref:hypothetical protein n=1 Tax=Variovorax sp. M-6 TaxID=3233041 RepID=UPI003F950543
MNIYPVRTTSPSAPPEWTIEFCYENSGSISQCICVILRSGEEMCRLSVARDQGECAQAKVAESARAWIAEFLARPAEYMPEGYPTPRPSATAAP